MHVRCAMTGEGCGEPEAIGSHDDEGYPHQIPKG